MIEKNHPSLSVGAQCRLLSISRSSFYYAPQGETAMNLALMRLIERMIRLVPETVHTNNVSYFRTGPALAWP